MTNGFNNNVTNCIVLRDWLCWDAGSSGPVQLLAAAQLHTLLGRLVRCSRWDSAIDVLQRMPELICPAPVGMGHSCRQFSQPQRYRGISLGHGYHGSCKWLCLRNVELLYWAAVVNVTAVFERSRSVQTRKLQSAYSHAMLCVW